MIVSDWLRKVFGSDTQIADNEVELNLLSGNHSANHSSKMVVKNGATVNVVNIYVEKLEPAMLQSLTKMMPEALEKEDTLITTSSSDEILSEITAIEPETTLIDYFKNKIPISDLRVLEASLYLKVLTEKGETAKVARLRDGLICEYGQRGRTISNLCTAGYFETIIKPLYEEMRQGEDFSEDLFRRYYNKIIEEFPFAFFVHSKMGFEELKISVLKKIANDKKYGTKTIRIHGIGNKNVSNIRKLITDQDILEVAAGIPNIESGSKYIILEITIK